MKKLMNTVFAASLALTLAACGSSSAATEDTYAYLYDASKYEKPTVDTSKAEGKLKEILSKGTLVIATSPDYPPNEYVEEDGTIKGSEMMLAKYVADSLGVKLVIETMDFNGTMVAVDTNKVDMAFSGYGWKADREEQFELSIGYVGNTKDYGHTLIIPAADEGKYKSLEDFKGKHIMAQASSLQQMYVEDQIIALDPNAGTELELVATLDQAILGLSAGKCDAVALDGHTAENYVTQSEGQFALTNIKFDLTMYGEHEGNVALAKKGETSLINTVNEIIQFAADKGYYAEWYAFAREEAGIEE